MLWLIGGTSESAELVRRLGPGGAYVITVTTQRAKQLYPHCPQQVVVTRLTPATVGAFLQHYGIGKILDMSHPHAAQISQLAIQCAQDHHIPYLRYERPHTLTQHPQIHYWQNLAELCTSALFRQWHAERILVTLGYRQLPLLRDFWGSHTWFVRILPDATALETALAAGFRPQHIIALWPPVPLALERALWQHWRITQVIAKASGHPGGEVVKQQLAQELGVGLHLVQRPAIAYPQWTDDLQVALAFAQTANIKNPCSFLPRVTPSS